MESFYYIIALLTAGVSLSAGLIHIVSGLRKGGSTAELIFGTLAILIFLFLILPPVGFVLSDKAPYDTNIIVKRIFSFSYYILLPWFIKEYSGIRHRALAMLNAGVLAIAYFAMAFETVDGQRPLWLKLAMICFGLVLVIGIDASVKMIKSGRKSEGTWLLWAMAIYGILLLMGAINQLGSNFFGRLMGTRLFFPFHLNVFAFLILMGIRLRANIFEKYRLERVLRWNDIRWDSLVTNMRLAIVELDREGRIKFLNPFAVQALGFRKDTELLGKSWFDSFVPEEEKEIRKSLFLDSMTGKEMLAYSAAEVRCRDGSLKSFIWTNVFVYDEHMQPGGTMSIGMETTEQKKALDQIRALKTELEKENLLVKGQSAKRQPEPDIIGESEAILYALEKVRQVAPTHASVLLEGETGVGKELFAQLIHKNSYRAGGPFIVVNCAALPPELMESELFGHEKGAFTGALQARKGRFELAEGGTIFLDEVGELPLSLQPKLLRVLQSGEFERIGGQQTLKVDVRVISATNRELQAEIRSGQFREDLYYRLNVFPVTIPPLRNRMTDIPLLVSHFVKKLSAVHHKEVLDISRADLMRLMEYAWPGNVRELINVLERSIISSQGRTLKLEWLQAQNPPVEGPATDAIEEIEKAHILKVLNSSHWKINGPEGAATKLGLNPNTLRSRLKKLNISRPVE